MTTLIIPARGGSKGVPYKNLAHVGGRSLLVRYIEAARRVDLIEKIYVSTDNEAIAGLADSTGVSVIARPSELATDGATSESALLHALDHLEIHDGWFAFGQVTSPFATPEHLRSVIEPVATGQAEMSFSAAPFHGHVWEPDGSHGINFNPWGSATLPRQKRRPQIIETGMIYAMDVGRFRAYRNRFCGQAHPVLIDAWRGMEIDTIEDLKAAQALAPLIDHPSWSRDGN